jgi:hypothetical protein
MKLEVNNDLEVGHTTTKSLKGEIIVFRGQIRSFGRDSKIEGVGRRCFENGQL